MASRHGGIVCRGRNQTGWRSGRTSPNRACWTPHSRSARAGSEAQKRQYLPGILSNETWWCQGYSEPNAGSDLASLKTTAVRDGDHYVVNGTKMRTTEAHWPDMMHCLIRTDRDVKPQRGISFLLIDMTTPGITIRPIVTIDGQHHTNQTLFR